MLLALLHTNPTQAAGLIGFGLAAAAAGLAARRTSIGTGRRGWRAIAALQALCVAEVLIGFRHRAHDLVGVALQLHGTYGARVPLQQELLIAALALGAATLLGLWWLTRREPVPLRIAAIATALGLGLFAIEAISLHAVDAVMYRSIDGLLLIGACWLALAAFVIAAAVRAAAVSRESARAHRR